jgi:UMF1 family MFS transporter
MKKLQVTKSPTGDCPGASRTIVSWCLFDFANSSYSAVIAAVIFPVYYTTYIVGTNQGLGDLWWGRAISASMAFVALSSPFLGGLADFSGMRKRLLALFTGLCIVATALLIFLEKGMVLTGFLLIVAANVGMEGGLVFYNTFLPLIAQPGRQGRVSAWGFGTGYAGSILSLLIALGLLQYGQIGYVWPMVAAFFLLFAVPAFLFLPSDRPSQSGLAASSKAGLRSTVSTLRDVLADKDCRRFLLAYLCYEDGVNTVIVFSSIFAAVTLGCTQGELIALYLVVQATALAGAFMAGGPIDRRGPKPVVRVTLVLWTAVAAVTYFVETKSAFFIIASVAGLGLGSVQAASRAFFSRFIPKGMESQYFGLYSLVGKSSAVLGPLIFGYVSSATGSQRPAVLSVAVLFLAGLVVLQMVRSGGPAAEGDVRR